ncbi:DeoR family transcriptional regulator, fructose operon transcriptional repressor [Brevibacillus sp. IT-7CA2]|uniref:DeoR/GlpR family DNA-binding transcription regulator n=1 Tax=Brevibacillus sp. IT-7CA2 TaxID=3026436 RepID=UPI0039E0BE81
MLQEERQQLILQMLQENQSVRIAELCSRLTVTRETIRRDLYEMEQQGLLKKVHGGAILNKTNVEPPYAKRSGLNLAEKEAIAVAAASLVEDGDAIYIDLGTTTQLFAKHLYHKKGITVITNALLVALELSHHPDAKVIMSGGELRAGDLAMSGPIARKSLEGLFVDKAFIGVGGLAAETGFTDYHVGESDIRQLMLTNAKETYALIDHSKINVTAFMKVAELSDIDVVITDEELPQSLAGRLAQEGLQVIVAKTSV